MIHPLNCPCDKCASGGNTPLRALDLTRQLVQLAKEGLTPESKLKLDRIEQEIKLNREPYDLP